MGGWQAGPAPDGVTGLIWGGAGWEEGLQELLEWPRPLLGLGGDQGQGQWGEGLQADQGGSSHRGQGQLGVGATGGWPASQAPIGMGGEIRGGAASRRTVGLL